MDQVFDELSSDGVECVEYYSDCDENAQYMDRRVDGIPSWGLIILKEHFLSLSLWPSKGLEAPGHQPCSSWSGIFQNSSLITVVLVGLFNQTETRVYHCVSGWDDVYIHYSCVQEHTRIFHKYDYGDHHIIKKEPM